ncbi:MAG: hypothetical protein ACOYXO_14195, partial [Chloroflexota bacterium]
MGIVFRFFNQERVKLHINPTKEKSIMANKKIYLDFREDELSSAAIYEALAGIEKDERIRQVYEKMAAVERKHAKNWEEKLRAEGVEPPPFQPTLRVRLLIWLAKRFGPEMIIPSLQAMEKDGGSAYLKVESGKHMARDEQTHALVLGQIKNLARGGMEGSA